MCVQETRDRDRDRGEGSWFEWWLDECRLHAFPSHATAACSTPPSAVLHTTHGTRHLTGGGNTPGSWLSESLTEHIRSGAVTPPFIRRGIDARDVPPSPKAEWQAGEYPCCFFRVFFVCFFFHLCARACVKYALCCVRGAR